MGGPRRRRSDAHLESLVDHLGRPLAEGNLRRAFGLANRLRPGAAAARRHSAAVAGYLAHVKLVEVNAMFLLSFASVLTGDSGAFFMGRVFGQRVLRSRLARRFFTPPPAAARARLLSATAARWSSSVAFFPGLRFSIFFSAGTLHVRPRCSSSTTRWPPSSIPLLVYSAWYFGDYISRVIVYAHRTENGIFILAGAGVVVIALKAWFGRKRRGKGPPRIRHRHQP